MCTVATLYWDWAVKVALSWGLGSKISHFTGGLEIPKQQYPKIFALKPYISSREGDSNLLLGNMSSIIGTGKWFEVPLFNL